MHSVLNESDFISIINKTIDFANKLDFNAKNKNSDYLGGSISSYTKNLIMSFPVLVDDGLTIETSQIISKANEKNIASMLEMLFASMSINGNNGKEILAKYHKNIDSLSMDDIIDYTNELIHTNENYEYMPKLSNAEIRDCIREMTLALKEPQKSFPIESLNERGINGYLCKEGYNNGVMVYEISADQMMNQALDGIYGKTGVSDLEKLNYAKERNKIEDKQAADKLAFEKEKLDAQKKHQRDQLATQIQRDALDRKNQQAKDALDRRNQFNKDEISINQRRVLDSDFKKANELQPTSMIVTFNVMGPEGIEDRKSFIAGVKCRMIATSSLDIAERLMVTNKVQLSFKNLIRATTGEIKLKDDFLLAISQQKLDAKNDVKKGEAAKLWSVLKKRSIMNNYRKLMKDKNDATAIATLVVSQATVDYMISTTKFDISQPKNAKTIMDTYNLLCLVIADETNEVAKFLYDGNTQFEALSFNVLSKEFNDKNTKKELNLISQRR